MGSTYACILFHIVFSTKHREALITPEVRPRLDAFMGGIVRDEGGVLLAIGGMSDHQHLLVSWHTKGAVADLVCNVKSRSSPWVNDTFRSPRKFAWQEGYGVFSTSYSHRERLVRYIARQEEHHKRRTYEEEFLALLEAHGIEYKAPYVLD